MTILKGVTMARKNEGKAVNYPFSISFSTPEEKEAFKNYVFSRKTSHSIPVYKTVLEMLELHREKYQRKG
jgi:hypothetical protein